MNEQEDFLEHYGIKGMRWGIRKERSRSSGKERVAAAKKKKMSALSKKQARKKTKEAARKKEQSKTAKEEHDELLKTRDPKKLYRNVHKLSDAELTSRLNRLQKEDQLRKLAEQSSSRKSENFVNKIIKTGKKANELYDLYNSPLGKAIRKKLSSSDEPDVPDSLKSVKNKAKKEPLDLDEDAYRLSSKESKRIEKELRKEQLRREKETKKTIDEINRTIDEVEKHLDKDQSHLGSESAIDTINRGIDEVERQLKKDQSKWQSTDEINDVLDEIEKRLKKDDLN